MNEKTENVGISEDRLYAELSEIIDKKQLELLRLTNSGLITLFWEIGKELNHSLGKNKRAGYSKSTVIRTISNQLVASYGAYFTERNLKKMGQFANQFPDFIDVLQQVVSYVSWEHIVFLLKAKDVEARVFYVRLTVEEGLSPNSLRKQISANIFEQKKGGARTLHAGRTGKHNQAHLKILQPAPWQSIHNYPEIKNVFKEPLLSSFRALLEPSKASAELIIEKNLKATAIEEDLFEALSGHIKKYRTRQNSLLNSRLNLAFREIGKRISQFFLDSENIDRDSVVHTASIHLEKQYGENFNEKQLHEMAKFADQFTDLIAARISSLVSWSHILILLPLQELGARLFYARLTAAQGLSIAGLEKQIAENAYEKTLGAKELEQDTIAKILNPVIEKTTEQKGNHIFKGTTVYIDLGNDISDSLAVTNILKNPYLSSWVLAGKK